ncbi:MAG TPA: hypothetical protein VJY12_10595 [Dysgonamonadaceae bacterium]|nr:hypothetical protein [Dysgonamonadaceae bacterium]
MSTPFNDIYSIFLNDITDEDFINLMTPEELGDVLEDYLMESAAIHFRECKQDLGDFDRELKQYNVALTRQEKTILAKGMKLKWIDSNHLANERNLTSKLTTKDYKIFSPANHLRILGNMQKDLKSEIRNLVVQYQYDHWKGIESTWI